MYNIIMHIHNPTLKSDMLEYIGNHKRLRPCYIQLHYYLSRTRIHQVLKELMTEGKLVKTGKFPKIYYHLNRNFKPITTISPEKVKPDINSAVNVKKHTRNNQPARIYQAYSHTKHLRAKAL